MGLIAVRVGPVFIDQRPYLVGLCVQRGGTEQLLEMGWEHCGNSASDGFQDGAPEGFDPACVVVVDEEVQAGQELFRWHRTEWRDLPRRRKRAQQVFHGPRPAQDPYVPGAVGGIDLSQHPSRLRPLLRRGAAVPPDNGAVPGWGGARGEPFIDVDDVDPVSRKQVLGFDLGGDFSADQRPDRCPQGVDAEPLTHRYGYYAGVVVDTAVAVAVS